MVTARNRWITTTRRWRHGVGFRCSSLRGRSAMCARRRPARERLVRDRRGRIAVSRRSGGGRRPMPGVVRRSRQRLRREVEAMEALARAREQPSPTSPRRPRARGCMIGADRRSRVGCRWRIAVEGLQERGVGLLGRARGRRTRMERRKGARSRCRTGR